MTLEQRVEKLEKEYNENKMQPLESEPSGCGKLTVPLTPWCFVPVLTAALDCSLTERI